MITYMYDIIFRNKKIDKNKKYIILTMPTSKSKFNETFIYDKIIGFHLYIANCQLTHFYQTEIKVQLCKNVKIQRFAALYIVVFGSNEKLSLIQEKKSETKQKQVETNEMTHQIGCTIPRLYRFVFFFLFF